MSTSAVRTFVPVLVRALALVLGAGLLVACAPDGVNGPPSPARTRVEAPAAEPVPAPPTGTEATVETPETAAMSETNEPETATETTTGTATEVATLGAGCFWCIEAVLEQIEGVEDVRSGYMGGHVENPTYRQICTGTTGHAEVVQVTFRPAELSYADLLDWFWRLHDPTTHNRQGADEGPQYRSAIFTHSEEQADAARRSRDQVDASGTFDDPIVTQISPASTFYEAEDYHQDYYRANRSQPYCQVVIRPKLDKLGLEK